LKDGCNGPNSRRAYVGFQNLSHSSKITGSPKGSESVLWFASEEAKVSYI
jgi:hypothetical protein